MVLMPTFIQDLPKVLDKAAELLIQKGKSESFLKWVRGVSNRKLSTEKDAKWRVRLRVLGEEARVAVDVARPTRHWQWGIVGWVVPLGNLVWDKVNENPEEKDIWASSAENSKDNAEGNDSAGGEDGEKTDDDKTKTDEGGEARGASDISPATRWSGRTIPPGFERPPGFEEDLTFEDMEADDAGIQTSLAPHGTPIRRSKRLCNP